MSTLPFSLMTPVTFILKLSMASLFWIGPALAKEPARLNSERIKAKFGSYGIEVLEHKPVRVSKLFSTHGDKQICRTFAIVEFTDPDPVPLKHVLNRVRAGASLGATLKDSGWNVSKQYIYAGEIPAGPRFLKIANINRPEDLAVAIYDLKATKDTTVYTVATVIEIHHPEYLNLQDLLKLAVIRSTPESKIRDFLELAREKMKLNG